ncbi:sigma-70 family RNA polymerase sigma factor [bacterium]|jgi:RNA polymerase sigma factor (sigma-70 family)|nr:sigma-70 family RNA polymerase sigma factor [bacterium]MBT6831721.1 sigma-70 family RNA polymerase sigma factor [bacterium]MBT6996544.1 sigma-70 family RNA polymerase sigma factor [bacterium]MBT7772870.1 sigma-70 family RNA polymerase sigma factor [bacterium]
MEKLNGEKKFLEKEEKEILEFLFDEPFRTSLFKKILSIVQIPADAEDVFQNVSIKIVEAVRAGKYKNQGTPRAWIFQIANNAAIDFLREKKKKEVGIAFSAVISNPNGMTWQEIIPDGAAAFLQDEIEAEELAAMMVKKLVAVLSPDQARAISLVARGKKRREVAEIMGVCINTATGFVQHGRVRIAKMLEFAEMKLPVQRGNVKKLRRD